MISRRTSSPVFVALGAATAATLLVFIARAQITKYARTKDFRYSEHYDRPISPGNPTNALKVLIRGAEGQYLTNDRVRITTARIEQFPITGKGTNLVATTPVCLFDPDDHSLSSTDRVEIIARDGAIVLNGNAGFQFDMTNTTLHVSNRVRAIIQGNLLKPGRTTNP